MLCDVKKLVINIFSTLNFAEFIDMTLVRTASLGIIIIKILCKFWLFFIMNNE